MLVTKTIGDQLCSAVGAWTLVVSSCFRWYNSLSCQQLVTEHQDNQMHATTAVVDVSTLNHLPAQETSDVMLLLATPSHLPRLQLTVDQLPVMVARRYRRTAVRAGSRSVADGGRVDDWGEEEQEDGEAKNWRWQHRNMAARTARDVADLQQNVSTPTSLMIARHHVDSVVHFFTAIRCNTLPLQFNQLAIFVRDT